MNQRRGISLIELLISMAILGILLALLSAFLVNNQQVTTTQISSATLSNDVRLAHLRITEVVTQGHYIYPTGQNISINGTLYTTGQTALAVLVPRGTTYCNKTNTADSRRDYCGFAYVVVDRTPYTALLGSGQGTTNRALVEFRRDGLTWNQPTSGTDTNPAVNLLNWGTATAVSPVADSVDSTGTSLGSSLTFSSIPASFDEESKFERTGATNASKALIGGVTSTIALERTIRGKPVSVSRDNYVFSKAVPRSALPNAPK